MRYGGKERQKAQSRVLAFCTAQAYNSKIKNAIPMYALTLKKRHVPMPTRVSESMQKTPSSFRKRHFSSFCVKARRATEKMVERRKRKEANKTFCVKRLRGRIPFKGRLYSVKGALDTKTPREMDRASMGNNPVFIGVLGCVFLSRR